MMIAAIIEPMTLLGSELRQASAAHQDVYREIRLLTFNSDLIGGFGDAGGKPALVQEATREALEGVDVIFDCGGGEQTSELLSDAPEDAVTILIDPPRTPDTVVPVVDGVNLESAMESNVLVSPDASIILLAHILAPLTDLHVNWVVGHFLTPASSRGQEGLDELFDQTRAILAMSQDRPEAVFGAQSAFNLLPIKSPGKDDTALLSSILGTPIDLETASTQAGVFHCLSASLLVQVSRETSTDAVAERLAQSRYLELSDSPNTLGPVDAAGSDRIMLSSPEVSASRKDTFHIWAVMDNLTRGGALNALAIAEYILTHRN
jgi:aspartate-semialdehyde dehydrogenase